MTDFLSYRVFVLVAAVGLTQVTTGAAPELPEAWNIPGGEKLALALGAHI